MLSLASVTTTLFNVIVVRVVSGPVLPPSKLEAPFGWDQHSPTCFFKALDRGLALSFEFLKTFARGDHCSLAKAISKICEFASQAGVILDRDFDT
jgi:hypothetical protein